MSGAAACEDGRVPRWTCPACGRSFGKRNQSHVCVPTMPIEEYLDRLDHDKRAACEAVLDCLAGLEDVVVEAAEVGLLIKRGRTFAELRPKRGRMEFMISVLREIEHSRIRRSARYGRRFYLFVDLRCAEDFDADVRSWLMESYEAYPL
jgi:hypothetical protein